MSRLPGSHIELVPYKAIDGFYFVVGYNGVLGIVHHDDIGMASDADRAAYETQGALLLETLREVCDEIAAEHEAYRKLGER